MPAPSVPSCFLPLAFAFWLTLPGFGQSSAPFDSQCSRSSLFPYPFSTAHLAPFSMTCSSSLSSSFISESLPTPQGTLLKSWSRSSSIFFCTSSFPRFDASTLTPQFISKPIPPGVIMPVSESKAATPPIENPYPMCISGIANECLRMPGIAATFFTCWIDLSSLISSRSFSLTKILPETFISPSLGISQVTSLIFLSLIFSIQ